MRFERPPATSSAVRGSPTRGPRAASQPVTAGRSRPGGAGRPTGSDMPVTVEPPAVVVHHGAHAAHPGAHAAALERHGRLRARQQRPVPAAARGRPRRRLRGRRQRRGGFRRRDRPARGALADRVPASPSSTGRRRSPSTSGSPTCRAPASTSDTRCWTRTRRDAGAACYARAETTLVLFDRVNDRPRRMTPSERERLEAWRDGPVRWRHRARATPERAPLSACADDILELPDAEALDDLATFAGRARRVDPDGACRLVATGTRAGGVRLARARRRRPDGAGPARRSRSRRRPTLDVTVPLAALLDRFAARSTAGGAAPTLAAYRPPQCRSGVGGGGAPAVGLGRRRPARRAPPCGRSPRTGSGRSRTASRPGPGAQAVARLRGQVWGRPIDA